MMMLQAKLIWNWHFHFRKYRCVDSSVTKPNPNPNPIQTKPNQAKNTSFESGDRQWRGLPFTLTSSVGSGSLAPESRKWVAGLLQELYRKSWSWFPKWQRWSHWDGRGWWGFWRTDLILGSYATEESHGWKEGLTGRRLQGRGCSTSIRYSQDFARLNSFQVSVSGGKGLFHGVFEWLSLQQGLLWFALFCFGFLKRNLFILPEFHPCLQHTSAIFSFHFLHPIPLVFLSIFHLLLFIYLFVYLLFGF
jgi:hypothetical protein